MAWLKVGYDLIIYYYLKGFNSTMAWLKVPVAAQWHRQQSYSLNSTMAWLKGFYKFYHNE